MKRVVYTCPFIPAEWVQAHGCMPGRIAPRPVAAGSAPRSGVCLYAWAFLQSVLADDSADAAVFTTRCDQMRRLSEIAARGARVPVFLMNVPATWRTPSSRGLYISELKRLGRFLTQIGGTCPSPEDVIAAAREYEAERAKIRARPRREGQARLVAPTPGRGGGRVRLALVGGPMAAHEGELFDLIERAGGTVVLDATVSGELGMPPPLDLAAVAADPLEALANAYFETIPDASCRPNDKLDRWLGERIAERRVQGIVFRHYTWCDTWHAEAQRLKEWAGVPVVVITATGDGEFDRHAASRIEALIEMLR